MLNLLCSIDGDEGDGSGEGFGHRVLRSHLETSPRKVLTRGLRTYTLDPDGTVHVLNETWSDGKRASIEGSAYKADGKSDEAKLKVKFYVLPFLPLIPVTGDYWVLYIDEDYQYVLIGQPSRKSLWILSRKSNMDEETYIMLVQKAMGKDTM